MARIVNPVVGELNPNIYTAAQSAGLSDQEATVIEQFSFTVKNAKRLRAMDTKMAKQQFEALDDDAKELIKAMYPNAEFVKEDVSLLRKTFGIVKTVAETAASPIVATFKIAGEYGKILNTPYSAARQIQQGASPGLNKGLNPFAKTVWSQAYAGKDLYDKGAISRLEEKYTPEYVLLAKGILAGKTPGEVIEQYGKVDAKITEAIMVAFDEPKKFNLILEDVKYAQTSPGRDVFRSAIEAEVKPGYKTNPILKFFAGDLGNVEVAKKWQKTLKRATGYTDATYQIFVDPLTYMTFGTSKAATKGAQYADVITKEAKDGNYIGAVKSIFAKPDVANLWNGELGVLIKRFADSENNAEKSLAYREIAQKYKGFSNFEIIQTLSKAKTFDAPSAERFFTDIVNANMLLAGRVDGITFLRNGIATARNQRGISGGMAASADAIFNPSARSKSTLDKVNELQSKGTEAADILKTVGDDIDKGVNIAGIARFTDIDADIKKARRIAEVVGRSMSRNPAGSRILFGEDAVKTAETFRLVARQAFTRDVADYVTFEFLAASTNDQIVILRNLYATIMHRYGLHGTPEGRKLIDEVLNKTFNNQSGMTAVARTEIPKDFMDDVSEYVVRVESDIPFLEARGAIQPSQLAEGVAVLNYEEIIQVAAMTRRKNSISALFDGATRNKYVSELVNLWTIYTLFPRLGIRSAIDETFMYALSAPAQDLLNFARPSLRKERAVLTALTGSKAAVGPIKRGLNKAFRKGGAEERLSIEDRIRIPQEIADSKGIPLEEVTNMMIREETVQRVFSMYGADEAIGNFKWIKEAFIYNPDTLNSMASSVAARSSLSGRLDKEIIDAIFTESTLSQALNNLSLNKGRKFRPLSSEQLRRVNDKYLTLAHFDQFFRRFVANTRTIAPGVVVDPVTSFFRNNGLRTSQDFAIARTEMLEVLGVKYDYQIKKFFIDPKRADGVTKFLNEFGDTTGFRQRGVGDADIARIHVETMLLDMRTAFHGGPNSFNDKLFDAVVARHNALVKYEDEVGNKIAGKWSKSTGGISFEEFEKATVGSRLQGEINTSIEFTELIPRQELQSLWAKHGDVLMEQMDRQVTGIFRQPAVLATYTRLRDQYVGLQAEFAKSTKASLLAENKNMKEEVAEEIAESLAAKRYTEIAMNEAVDRVLQYVDNPAIRSNFAVSTRTVARFYRATEDFWRRYYRLMREKPLQVVYRMRLAHQGLSARGEIYYDDQGEPNVVLPTDTIINSAVQPVMQKLTGGSFKVPQFNDVTLKLRLVNPSFSPDAGMFSFSGPVAALSFIGFRSILGYAPGPLDAPAENLADEIDTIALGYLGDDITIQRAIVPMFLQNVRNMLPRQEMSRQEITAAFQAIAYIQAFGDESIQLPENPTDEQKNEYLKTIKIASHNVIAARSLLGMISPITPTLTEGKGVPDYLKRVGVTSLRSEFFDILAGISKAESNEVFDPYELAVAMFIGKNPRKIIYTVSRSDKNTKVLIQKTNEVKKWSITNKNTIDTYGEAAYIFAPQVGDYTSSAYAWLEANDLVGIPSLEKYLDNVQIARAKQQYFDIERQERELLDKEASIPERRAIINRATSARTQIKSANPLLNLSLQTGGFEIATEEKLFSSLEQMLFDKETPISSSTRQNMAIASKAIREFISFSNDPEMKLIWNFVDAKRAKRKAIEQALEPLIQVDPAVREANRSIFSSILKFYSRDTYSIGGN
jgi:hypothetical protein